MARGLRFFKDQMLKAGVSPKYSTTPVDLNIDDLEVCEHPCGHVWFVQICISGYVFVMVFDFSQANKTKA